MSGNMFIYLALMCIVTMCVKILPLTLIRKQITNPFVVSFLYYVPYVTLAVMTFPAIIEATDSLPAGILALVAGLVAAWLGAGLFPVACICCLVVFVSEFFFLGM